MIQSTLRGMTEWVYRSVCIKGNFRLAKSKVEKTFLNIFGIRLYKDGNHNITYNENLKSN
jgi:hypothetical protein